MKVLILGSDYNWSIERIYKRELLEIGHDVLHLPVQNWYYDYYYKSIYHKLFCRIGLSNIHKTIQERLLAYVNGTKFDLIWVFKGMEIKPNTLIELKRLTNRLINFNPDNPFVFSGKGSGNRNIIKSLSLYDEHFSYNQSVCKKIELEYGLKCTWIQFGFDSSVFVKDNDQEEIKALCFIGNPDSNRIKILQEVVKKGIPIHVYGHGWDRYLVHDNLSVHDPVYEDEYYKTLFKYRVQLNIMRPHNLDSHNMRTMEIGGCGGIMLLPETKDHVIFFEQGKEAFFYSNISDLISTAENILNLPYSEVQKIRIAARKKVLSNFTYSKLVLRFIQG